MYFLPSWSAWSDQPIFCIIWIGFVIRLVDSEEVPRCHCACLFLNDSLFLALLCVFVSERRWGIWDSRSLTRNVSQQKETSNSVDAFLRPKNDSLSDKVTAAQVTNVDAARPVNPLKIRVETCNYILFYITFHLFQLCWIVNPQTHFDITSHSISFNLFSLLAYSCISICLEEKGIVITVYHLNRCVLEMGKLLSVSQPVGWRRRVAATLSAIPLSLHPSIIYRLVSYFVPQKHSPCPPSILLAGCHPNSHNCPVIFLWLLGREFLRIEHVNQIMRECIFAT